ncbi:DUF4344 domain-containing metallopeptidase [Pacificoceanicola onchidii]|uniref:DUF4344 domain-containing metallopeptidase n=1 Tax=Pacificoceanicola onchidii TaxID=2562685 RepID=UPI0010A675BC|nr:DUF4344 domain-containing metallopeptidase [Pacificoceanicola onchidii]
MIRNQALGLALCLTPTLPLAEQTPADDFVSSNVRAIFYHELAHAVIDLMQVPIFGQEEDAADVMAVLLIDWLFDEEVAQQLAYDSAFGFLDDPDGMQDVAYWDVHGPDEQRFYNHVCLFYGANPEVRDTLAEDLGLPEERAETCPEEYDLAADSWGAVFDEMEGAELAVPMRFIPDPSEPLASEIIAEEVAALNQDLRLPQELIVRVESCGEANAYYDLGEISITFCSEFVPHLRDLHDQVFDQ